MRNNFYKVTLKEILSVKRGVSLSGEYYATKGNKIRLTLGNFNYPNGGFKENLSKENIYFIGPVKDEFILHSGDIITPLTEQVAGLLGETAKIPADNIYIQSGDIGLVIPKENKLYKDYAYYLIFSKSIKHQIGVSAQQTKIRHTSPEKIENCIAWIPSNLEVQKNISDFLDALTDKIVLNNKIITELENIAKTLYNYWFVQFDFPDEKGRPYKSANGKMVYNEILKREIPIGWEVQPLSENNLTSIIKPGIDIFDGEKVYLPTAAIDADRIANRSNIITFDNRESRANMQPISNSVWFAKMKDTKKDLYFGSYSHQRINDVILSTGMFGLKCQDNALEFVWNFINNSNFEAQKDKLAHGATQESVNKDDLIYIPILVPSNNILDRFSYKTKTIYKQKYIYEQENFTLEKIRNFILPLLMNGQVSVQP